MFSPQDSVMCILNAGPENRTNMAAHFKMAQHVSDEITKAFQKPNELEFEKCYYPYLLFSKKRYAGMLYSSSPERPDYMDVKGLQLVRRDSAPIARKVSTEILETIMREKSLPPAVEVAKLHLLNLLHNRVPLQDYVVSKSLRAEYKAPDSQPHLQVAKKIHQRRGYPVPSGERVPFVFIEDDSKVDGLQAQRAEDPSYCAENKLQLDRLHYLDSQLSGPMETLLDILAPGTFASVLHSEEICPLVDALRARKNAAIKIVKRHRTNAVNKQREITSFFGR
jgi:DNA polymerase delta subunit 1